MDSHVSREYLPHIIQGGKKGFIAALVALIFTVSYIFFSASSFSLLVISFWVFAVGGPVYAFSLALLFRDWRVLIGPIVAAFLFLIWTVAPGSLLFLPFFLISMLLAVIALALLAPGLKGKAVVAATVTGGGIVVTMIAIAVHVVVTTNRLTPILVLSLLGRPLTAMIAVATPFFGALYGAAWEICYTMKEQQKPAS